MKITFLFGLLCLLTPAPAVSRLLQEEVGESTEPNTTKNEEKDTAVSSMEYGYREAKTLWDSREYSCKSITKGYWVHVKNTVFNTCHSKWADSSKESKLYFQECKTGAQNFALEAMDNCFDEDECKQVGINVAVMIADRFCNSGDGGSMMEEAEENGAGGWMPAKCAEFANESCNSDASDTVTKFIQDGACSSEDGAALENVSADDISVLCETTLSAMEEAAKLT
jgi:hypothetical protein